MSNLSATQELKQFLSAVPVGQQGQNSVLVAHSALQSLRDSGDQRFLFLRTILELQQNFEIRDNDELLFHCITCLRQIVLQRWRSLSKEFCDMTGDFLIKLGNERTYPRIIRVACYTSAASFWKRKWKNNEPSSIYPTPEEKSLIQAMNSTQPIQLSTEEKLFQYIESLLQLDYPNIVSACQFLSVLIGEFRGKSSVQYHLPLEFHKKVHTTFEQDGWLDHVLRMCMVTLSNIVGNLSTKNEVNPALLHIVQLTIDILTWEFGSEAWGSGVTSSLSKTLLRPPQRWRKFLIRPDFCGAIFHAHKLVTKNFPELAHSLRQLLLLLASMSGPILDEKCQQLPYATYLLDGTLELLSMSITTKNSEESMLLDSLSIVSRLIANFKLGNLAKMLNFPRLLNAVGDIGANLLQANVDECESVKGDIESMENHEWREEALSIILESCILLSEDPWLLYTSNENLRRTAQSILVDTLCPLYRFFLHCRIKMARTEEMYCMAELDEVREEISAVALKEEMAGVASLGRMILKSSLSSILEMLKPVFEKLRSLWDPKYSTQMIPEIAALFEEARLLILSLGYLLTDDNEGETPVIPEYIMIACRNDIDIIDNIAASVEVIMNLAQFQASKLTENPNDTTLSPLLAITFLWFLNRWGPTYILPINVGSSDGKPNKILSTWGEERNAEQAVAFCTTLCLHYQCYWPLENQVQKSASKLLFQLAKRGGGIRKLLLNAPSFRQMATLHCLTAGLRHGAPHAELENQINMHASECPVQMAKGYHRLPYCDRSQLLTIILVASCLKENENETANLIFNRCLESVFDAFQQFVEALACKRISASNVNAKEMACLCVAMYGGIARSSGVDDPAKVIQFMTYSLQELSNLMNFYAQDLTICELLLALFRDYTEYFVSMLSKEQSLILFRSAGNLLQTYSANHCASRAIIRPTVSSTEVMVEEHQSYNDILSAIQLLTHLGTKDFLDTCNANRDKLETGDVTDIIFFGIQQIIPLMTQGLLQYPSLCKNYFSLLSFMMDTYPGKVCILPFELFNALMESLVFGMTHMDALIAKSSLRSISCIAKEQIQNHALEEHLRNHPDVFDKCSYRLLQEVIFQKVVWDRLEASGMALLPLAAVDISRFVAVVSNIAKQLPGEQQLRMIKGFETLMEPQILSKAFSVGLESRKMRLSFQKKFEVFVKEIHSFIVLH